MLVVALFSLAAAVVGIPFDSIGRVPHVPAWGARGARDPFPPLNPPESLTVAGYAWDITLSDESDRIVVRAELEIAFHAALDTLRVDLVGPSNGTGMTISRLASACTAAALPYSHVGRVVDINITAADRACGRFAIDYDGVPADGLIIGPNRYGRRGFFGDNWPNRAPHWLACIDHPSLKAPLLWTVRAPERYGVVANGVLVSRDVASDGTAVTVYKSEVPVNTKVAIIGASEFVVEDLEDVYSVPVSSWVFVDGDVEAALADFRVGGDVIEVLEDFLGGGTLFPYEKLANIQTRTRYGGMENSGAIAYDENRVGSGDIEFLIAHEIAHQWFGCSVSELEWSHIFVSEGFATYLDAIYREEVYGDAVFRAEMEVKKKRAMDFTDENPTRAIVDFSLDALEDLLSPLTYQKGAWFLHMSRKFVVDSDETFRTVLATYYERHAGSAVVTQDFLDVLAMGATGAVDFDAFADAWLFRPGYLDLELVVTEAGLTAVQHNQARFGVLYEGPLNLSGTTTTGTPFVLDVMLRRQERQSFDFSEPIAEVDLDNLADWFGRVAVTFSDPLA